VFGKGGALSLGLGFKSGEFEFGVWENLASVCHFFLLRHLCHYYLCHFYLCHFYLKPCNWCTGLKHTLRLKVSAILLDGHLQKLCRQSFTYIEGKSIKRGQRSISDFTGWIERFLSWKGFVVLSNISYCTYLVHQPVSQMIIYGARDVPFFTHTVLVSLLHPLSVLICIWCMKLYSM